uniref:Uncharacterized protein n=1 Tax=Heterorhabditis bacteriophora TaxID=37862 RepID=A0A1I7WT37_HETBA
MPPKTQPSKKAEQKRRMIFSILIRSATIQHFHVDPKSMVCLFFKQGMCQKGNKYPKKNIYVDSRDIKDEDVYLTIFYAFYILENMDDWDGDKLIDVVKIMKDPKVGVFLSLFFKYFL